MSTKLRKKEVFQSSDIMNRLPSGGGRKCELIYSEESFDPSEIFKKYDKVKKGYLTRHELRCALIFGLGSRPTHKQLIHYCSQAMHKGKAQHEQDSPQRKEKVTMDIFRIIFKEMKKDVCNTGGLADQINEAFNSMDIHNQKFISVDIFLNIIRNQCPAANLNDALNAFYEIDSNKDGRVTYKDFYDMIRFHLY